ncbi:unnamed protein product [Prunus brigantina]
MAIRALYFPPCLARFTESLPIKVFKFKAKKEAVGKIGLGARLGEYADIETHSRALLGVIDYEVAIHLWKVDKFDFVVCMSAYISFLAALKNWTSLSSCNICDQGTFVCGKAKEFCSRKPSEFHGLQKC